MTRGPQPLLALRGAREIACRRGLVLDRAGILSSHYDFIIFRETSTVFVRIKRVRSHISDPKDIERMFRDEILRLRRIPKTAVVSREIWVLSPWKTWQYFHVLDDRVVEICSDGQPFLRSEEVPGKA